MSDVKGPDRRRERGRLAAEASRRDVLEAAQRLLLLHGYAGTTIPAIASEAGVAVQTIYNTVGGKRAVLGGVVELAVRGPDYPASVSDTIGERIRAEPDARRIVELFVEWLVKVHARTSPIMVVIAEAAALEPEVAELERTLADARLAGYREVAVELARRGGLPRSIELDEAAATIWSLGHPQAYRFLRARGWADDRYRTWLVDALIRALGPSPPERGSPERAV
jgi:AcrR family transcriptional regulator